MKVLQINSFGNLSTGRITTDIYDILAANGHEGKIAFARNVIPGNIPCIKIGTELDVRVHGLLTRITDKNGFYSTKATQKLIKDIICYNPDIIHLHNIHGYYLNIKVLFSYLKQSGKPIVWTLHDCWSFTGHCCYYSIAECNKWKAGCYNCQQKKAYPASLVFDNSKNNYEVKRSLFSGVPKLTLVAVSQWLASEIKQSYLKDYPLEVIYNGVNTSVFKPTESNFRKKFGIEKKFVILGVASTWDNRKGLNDFIKLSQMLNDDYKVVVVGVSKKEMRKLPNSMIGVSRTDSLEELAGIYSTADIFFNASVEETFGLPSVEAMACGTFIIVYDSTALPEVVNKNCGKVVRKHDLTEVKNIILSRKKIQSSLENIRQNVLQNFDKDVNYNKYIELYNRL